MATDQDFDEYEVEVARKPVAGVELGEIPEKLATLLHRNVFVGFTDTAGNEVGPLYRADGTFDPDREVTIKAKDEAQAGRLLGYARAWGGRQTPTFRVTKMSNGKKYPPNVVRLKLEKEEEVGPENRPGRKAK